MATMTIAERGNSCSRKSINFRVIAMNFRKSMPRIGNRLIVHTCSADWSGEIAAGCLKGIKLDGRKIEQSPCLSDFALKLGDADIDP